MEKKKEIKEAEDEYKESICKGQDKKGSEENSARKPLLSSPPCLGQPWEHTVITRSDSSEYLKNIYI